MTSYRAIHIEQNPLEHFLSHPQQQDSGPFLRAADVILRANKDPKELFAHLIRAATASKWSHSAIIYLVNDPERGFDNTFLVEAKTKGVTIASWRNEVIPFEQFNVGIKRPDLAWYVESPREETRHDQSDPEDTHGIGYLRHVRGIAFDQINGLYDKKTVYELTGLYVKRVAQRHLSAIPQVAEAADGVAQLFKKWDEQEDAETQTLRFICSGLIQYSFFEALRLRIKDDLAHPERREAGLSNLHNLPRIIFHEDPQGLIPEYVQNVERGRLSINEPAPEAVLDLLKTALPADFNNSPNLQWRYVISKGVIWRIEEAPDGYQPESKEEGEVLEMLHPEHHSSRKQ